MALVHSGTRGGISASPPQALLVYPSPTGMVKFNRETLQALLGEGELEMGRFM